MSKFSDLSAAIQYLADALNLTTMGAEWVYYNTACPRWNDSAFSNYDFLNDPAIDIIPAEYI